MSKILRDPIRQRTVREGDKLYNDWKQPNRRAILEQAQERRKTASRVDLGAQIPKLDREVLSKRYPEALVHGDRRALEKFLNSSDGSKYRTTPRGRSKPRSFGGI